MEPSEPNCDGVRFTSLLLIFELKRMRPWDFLLQTTRLFPLIGSKHQNRTMKGRRPLIGGKSNQMDSLVHSTGRRLLGRRTGIGSSQRQQHRSESQLPRPVQRRRHQVEHEKRIEGRKATWNAGRYRLDHGQSVRPFGQSPRRRCGRFVSVRWFAVASVPGILQCCSRWRRLQNGVSRLCRSPSYNEESGHVRSWIQRRNHQRGLLVRSGRCVSHIFH